MLVDEPFLTSHPWTDEMGWLRIRLQEQDREALCREIKQYEAEGWMCWIEGRSPEGVPTAILFKKGAAE